MTRYMLYMTLYLTSTIIGNLIGIALWHYFHGGVPR